MADLSVGNSNKITEYKARNTQHLTGTDIDGGKKALDAMMFTLFDKDELAPNLSLVSNANSTVEIVYLAHPFKVGDVIKFETGLNQYEFRQIYYIETNLFRTAPFSSIPQAGDQFRVYGQTPLKTDNSGSIVATVSPTPLYINVDGVLTAINKNTIIPANSISMPVSISDPVVLTDGVNNVDVTASNELMVSDADLIAEVLVLSSNVGDNLDLKVTDPDASATVISSLKGSNQWSKDIKTSIDTTESNNVTRHSEIRLDLSGIDTSVDAVNTSVGSTNTKLDTVNTNIGSTNTKLDTVNTNLTNIKTGTDFLIKNSNQFAYDLSGTQYKYVGEAISGSLTSAASWKIERLEFLSGSPINSKFADGNINFDNIWDNRAALSYS